jgi:hypothetical protein
MAAKTSKKGAGRRSLRLPMAPVPESSWFQDLSNALPLAEWRELRDRTLRLTDGRCTACSTAGPLRVDADWEYVDRGHVQRLVGVTVLCSLCHLVRHIDQAEVLASQGRLQIERVVKQFRRVNRCSLRAYEEHRREALRIWRLRSRHTWTPDLSHKEHLLHAGQESNPLGGDWLDQLTAVAGDKRDRRNQDASVLRAYYRRHGIEKPSKKFYRSPAMRSCKV